MPYFSIKHCTDGTGFPELVKSLLEKARVCSNNVIPEEAVANIFKMLVHVLAIESGFVPLRKKPLRPVKKVVEAPVKKRMSKMIKDLESILKDNKDLKKVSYKFIVMNPDSPLEDEPSHAYADEVVDLTTVIDGMNLTVIFGSMKFSFSTTIIIAKYCGGKLPKKPPRSPNEFLKEVDVDCMGFSEDLKFSVIHKLLDAFGGVCFDIRSFCDLPNEVIMLILKKLDMRSIVKFSLTNRRNFSLVDYNEGELWKYLWQRRQTDFLSYGLRLNATAILVSCSDHNKQSYKKLYLSKVEESRARQRNAINSLVVQGFRRYL